MKRDFFIGVVLLASFSLVSFAKDRAPKAPVLEKVLELKDLGHEIVQTIDKDFDGDGVLEYLTVLRPIPGKTEEENDRDYLVLVSYVKKEKEWGQTGEVRGPGTSFKDLQIIRLGKEDVVFYHSAYASTQGSPQQVYQFFKVQGGQFVQITPSITSNMMDHQVLPEGAFLVAGTGFLPTDPAGLVVAQKFAYDGRRWVKVRHEATKFAPEQWPGIIDIYKKKIIFAK